MSSNQDIGHRLIIESSEASRRSVEMAHRLNIQNHLTCWHFNMVEDDQADQLHSALENLDQRLLDGGAIELMGLSIELWDNRLPEESWLQDRMPQVVEIADHFGVVLDGWSHEPKERAGKGIPQAFVSDEQGQR